MDVTRREKEKRESLDALARIAYSISGGNPAPAKPPEPPRSSLPKAPPKPAPKPAAAPPKPAAVAAPDAERARRLRMEERKAKMEEERALRARREGELARGANLGWRGMDQGGVPTGIRRTAFDRTEPSLAQKIGDVLGDAREKEGRAKQRDKGRRQGGR